MSSAWRPARRSWSTPTSGPAFSTRSTHNGFTLVGRASLPVLKDAPGRGVAVFNAALFGGGILAGPPRHRESYAYRLATSDLLTGVARLTVRCREGAVSLAAPAAVVRRHPLLDATVVGVSSAQRLDQLQALAGSPLPNPLLQELADLGAPTR